MKTDDEFIDFLRYTRDICYESLEVNIMLNSHKENINLILCRNSHFSYL